MNYSSKDLRLLINELDLDVLTAEDSGKKVLAHIESSYSEYKDKKLPKAVEAILYDKKARRSKNESFLTYCSRVATLFKEFERQWDLEQFKGYILYRHAHLSERAMDTVQT